MEDNKKALETESNKSNTFIIPHNKRPLNIANIFLGGIYEQR